MEINWFTVIAQVLNFFILVWLLKRFLYKPILKAIDQRENNIVKQLKESEAKKAEALKEKRNFEQKNNVFDQEKEDRIAKVIAETDEERQKLMDKARADAEVLSQKMATAALELQQNEQAALNQKIQKEIFAISRKALVDLASVGLEEQLTQVFIQRLKTLKEKELKQLKTAFESTSEPLLLRSAFTLPTKLQRMLKEALNEVLDSDSSLKFEKTPALIGGIELSTHEYKLAWSISEYLHEFEKAISKPTGKKTIPPVLEKQDV